MLVLGLKIDAYTLIIARPRSIFNVFEEESASNMAFGGYV
jgi:hypothetical protein